MTPRLRLALALVLAGALAPASASAASLPTVTRTLAGTGCSAQARYTAPMSGYLTVRLRGGGDWDLELGDGAASQGFGGSEVVQRWVAAGDDVTATGCRHAGASRSARVTFELLDVAPPANATAALVRVHTDAKRLAALDATGLDVTESRGPGWADVIVNGDREMRRLRSSGAKLDVRQADLGAYDRRILTRDNRRAARLAASPLPSGRDTYRTYEDIQAELKQLVADHASSVRPVVLGKSYQGREISGVEIARDVKGDDGRPTFFLMGVHHAREWPSAEIAMEYATLLANGGGDARIARILDTARVVVVPLVNPDGYVSTRTSPSATDSITNSPLGPAGADGTTQTGEAVAPPGGVGAYRRKNCNNEDDNPSTPCENAHGVDNNRNYGNLWGGPGSSADLTSQSYHGLAPRSEPETQAVFNYARTHHVTTLISLHTIAGLVLRPPGLHDGGKAPDEKALKDLGDRMAAATDYTSEYSFQLYDTAGTTEDDTYAATGGYGYTIEIGPSGGLFHGPYETNVIKQWTGDGEDANGGLHEALLQAAEEAAKDASHAQVTGIAPAGKVLRLHKDFTTVTSKYCLQGTDPAVATGAPTCNTPLMDPIELKDTTDFATTVPADGRFDWHIGPSTRPFVNGGAEIIDRIEDAQPPVATFNGAPGAPNDEVDFPFTAPADLGDSDKLRLDLTFSTPEDYDLELYLKKANGKLKQVGTSGNQPGLPETISIEDPVKGGEYVARVVYFAGATGQYTLTVTKMQAFTHFTTGSKEAYVLSCEEPGGKVLERYRFVIDRGQSVGLRLACGAGQSTDARGKPLNGSQDCPLPNTAPTIGCQTVPTGPVTGQTPAGRLKVRLKRAVRKQGLRKVLRRQGFIATRCTLSAPGRCTVRARLGKKRLGKGSVRMKRANTRTVKIKLSKRARRLLRRGGRLRLVATGTSPGLVKGRSKALRFRIKARS